MTRQRSVVDFAAALQAIEHERPAQRGPFSLRAPGEGGLGSPCVTLTEGAPVKINPLVDADYPITAQLVCNDATETNLN